MTPARLAEFWNPPCPPPLDLRADPSDHRAPLVPNVLELQFQSFPYRDQPTTVFALAALQEDPSAHPTAILVHGYEGIAAPFFDACAQRYFPLGYNVLALDLPGRREHSVPCRSTGIDMNLSNIYVEGDLRDSYYWHAVQAVRRTIDAAAHLGCDTNRLLLEGASLGGMTVLITAAADPRPQAVISHYACGYLHRARQAHEIDRLSAPASRAWRDAFDVVRQPQRPHLPIYIVTASNDEWFALPDQIVTRNRLGRQRVHLAVGPNLDHNLSAHLYGGINAFRRAFAAGKQPAWTELSRIELHHDQATFHLSGPAAQFQLVLADPATPDPATIDWHVLKWEVRDLPLQANTATCPASVLRHRIFYAHVTSQDNAVDSSVLFDAAATEFDCSLPPRLADTPI